MATGDRVCHLQKEAGRGVEVALFIVKRLTVLPTARIITPNHWHRRGGSLLDDKLHLVYIRKVEEI